MKGWSRNTLQWIALLSMLIDHIGSLFLTGQGVWYYLFRAVGRSSFPVFAFLLSEGFRYTSDRRVYLGRLLFFAMISEVPFDWMHGRLGNGCLELQNVLFELAAGLCMLWTIDRLSERLRDRRAVMIHGIRLGTVAVFGLLCQILHLEYGWSGMALIYVFSQWNYLPREVDWSAVAVIEWLSQGMFGLFGLPGVYVASVYDEHKKAQFPRYLLYLIYPLHLVLFSLIKK